MGAQGWNGQSRLWQLGDLKRAYYVAKAPKARDNNDPDAFHHGIAPAVKLLHAIVSRISEISFDATQDFSRRWKLNSSPIYIRLWAAISRNKEITPTNEVVVFLNTLDQDRFWDVQGFPEIAELRAMRLCDMSEEAKDAIVARIQDGPPRDRWSKKVNAAKLKEARLFWSLRELRRIELGGGILPERAKVLLDTHKARFAEIAEMTIDGGFPEGVTVAYREAKPDAKYEIISGVDRLKALEAALANGRRGWDDDPGERAEDWITQRGNADRLLADLESTNNGGDNFPNIWNRFGWTHRPRQQDSDKAQDAQLLGEAGRVLDLINRLSGTTLLSAAEGVCSWLNAWERHVVQLPLALPIWLLLWPIGVEITNRGPEDIEDTPLIVAANSEDDHQPMDLDTLNTPAGKLVGVFLAACPNLTLGIKGFSAGSIERQMRDAVIAAEGRSGLIARHRLIENLPYFLNADLDWAQEHLIAPLLNDDAAALALWRAVARRTRFTKVLESIGTAMVERANDRRLDRETRRGLVSSLIIEALYAYRELRTPAVPNQRIQQMLRTLDDEIRASAAQVIQRFIYDLSAGAATDSPKDRKKQRDPVLAADLFRSSAAPFLREVWPQERSLTTPGVSSALADLPAISGEAFAEAVDAIGRFLVPFDCWSMVDYGLFGEEGEEMKLASINDEVKAQSLLKLLDLTVGTTEGSIIPYDLPDALDQISSVSNSLSTNIIFRRLATAARRQ